MQVEVKVPEMGESISEVEIGQWLKPEGEYVERDEPIVEIQSEKATIELPSPVSGRLSKILKQANEAATVGEVIGYMEEADAPAVQKPKTKTPKSAAKPAPVVVAATTEEPKPLEAAAIPPMQPAVAAPQQARAERVVRMSPIRRTIAARLVLAQQNAALLTTFNEIDMAAVKAMRADVQEVFQARHGVKLGYMSLFVRACVHALQQFPELNAEVRGEDMVYHDYCDVGIAIGAGKGLVVPVLRNAEHMSLADIERAIADFAGRARDNKLAMAELQGGTFTITNGGVYGSLLSTPIINPPQSGVLGMHAIQDRPIALDGQIVIRPMMYVALTYDHRVVDGREAVMFLKAVKERIEKPGLLLGF